MAGKEIQYLKSFKDVCKKVNSSLELSEVLESIAQSTVKALDVRGCTIFLLDREEHTLRPRASCGLSRAYMHKGPVDADHSIIESLSGKAVLVMDAQHDERVQYRAEAQAEGIASILSVPMFVKDRVIGVLRIYTAEPREFTEEEEVFISGLADMGGIGIENARMYRHLKGNYENLINDVHRYFDYGTLP